MIHEKIIFWDWNGTLLNDTHTCLGIMNSMMTRRKMPVINLATYRDIFGFPVRNYYHKLGFDFSIESFEELSVEFIDRYSEEVSRTGLVNGAEEVLRHFKMRGAENVIVSAMKQEMLVESVEKNGVTELFTAILGIHDIYASGKSERANEYVKSRGISARDIVFIGDTTHDFEVAEIIGCRCILVADGHQAKDRLTGTGARVIDTLQELI